MFKSVIAAGIGQAALIAATECGPHLNSPDDITSFPTYPEGTDSYLSRNLTGSIWDEYADKKDSYGFSFKQAIFSGCKNPDSGVGVYAGSPDTYEAFYRFFRPVINQYHERAGDSWIEWGMSNVCLECADKARYRMAEYGVLDPIGEHASDMDYT